VLRKVGKVLREMGEGTIRVEGHTDDVPIARVYQYRYPSNWELSSARAAVVVRFLHQKTGVDPTNMEAVGLAYYRPVASNATAEGRARNRRVEIIISPRLPVAGRSDQG
jgi:chemotaxis protein MotB